MRASLTALFLGLATAATAAGGPGGHPHLERHHAKKEGTPPPGKPRDIPHTFERAGYPQTYRDHLAPTVTANAVGYYVGGGRAHGGEPRYAGEGTWGWDDTGGGFLHRHIRLLWSHGRRFQGGAGAYETDGRHVPDPIAGAVNTVQNHRE